MPRRSHLAAGISNITAKSVSDKNGFWGKLYLTRELTLPN
jgi:hypothetical protein